LLAVGGYMGLAWAPPERMMGDTQRIMYVHVPSVWMTLLCYTLVLFAAIAYLVKKDSKWDSLGEAAVEVGVFFNVLGLCLGAIWGTIAFLTTTASQLLERHTYFTASAAPRMPGGVPA
jgi:heme exporter protein C